MTLARKSVSVIFIPAVVYAYMHGEFGAVAETRGDITDGASREGLPLISDVS